MSLVVAAFDPADRVLEYSVAGHPFPLVRRGGTVSDLPGRPGILLALPFMVGKGYERHETRLEAGDQLLMFTDGLLEVTTDGDGSQLGRGGLADLFDRLATAPADELLSALVAEVASVDAAGVADDDRTAVLVVIH